MKKLFIKISSYFEKENFLNIIEKLQDILLRALPENWADNKKSFLLFWFISSFTLIFLIWAYFAQINQVVRASGEVRPDSKIHVIQSVNPGPIEAINISLGDEVSNGDILFVVDLENTQQLFDLSKMEVETRTRKVEIIESLVSKGSDSEFRLLDEKLALIEAQKRFDQAKRQLEFSYVRSPINGLVSSVNTRNIGPVDSTDYVGGNYAAALNIDTTLPMFFPTLENIDFRYFIDVANLWGVDYSNSVDQSNTVRSSTGFVVDWFTPIGPLNFSLSQDLSKADDDKTESFQFNLGTTF